MSEEPSLAEIARSIHRIETRLDRVFDDHEVRLRKLERWQYAVPPTLVLAGASVLAAILRGSA